MLGLFFALFSDQSRKFFAGCEGEAVLCRLTY